MSKRFFHHLKIIIIYKLFDTIKMINPIWKTFSQGCQLTKDFKQSLKMNGFKIEKENKFGNTVFISGIASVNN